MNYWSKKMKFIGYFIFYSSRLAIRYHLKLMSERNEFKNETK